MATDGARMFSGARDCELFDHDRRMSDVRGVEHDIERTLRASNIYEKI
jgi:hypothetical protein